MWLKIVYDEEAMVNWPDTNQKISVYIEDGDCVNINHGLKTFRVSPIFPLVNGINNINIEESIIYFFNFENAYKVLGRLDKIGSSELKNSTFFSVGLSSVILISSNSNIIDEFRKIILVKENAFEKWTINSGKISNIEYSFNPETTYPEPKIEFVDYQILPLTERAIIDEFLISMKLLLLKLTFHMPSEISKINNLILEINSLATDLVFLKNLNGTPPETLSEYTTEELKDPKQNKKIWHQNLDRIIQVNSALSYVSTQAFSGAIPILERRSIIRRNSLLGIGSAILAINRITKYIENSFSLVLFDDIIKTSMSSAPALTGLEDLPQYASEKWDSGSINIFHTNNNLDITYHKLPYFSGRLGYRETQYIIAAALQSVTSGASLEWSLMTITHEMLHSHVRDIITAIFYGNDKMNSEEQRSSFYDKFYKKMHKTSISENEIDSIRNIIFTYCCLTRNHGSLTAKKHYAAKYNIDVPPKDDLWNLLEKEQRNISEIFVHVLDLHYFYASKLSLYIPLIWCSWLSVPHVNGDLRQYILRSLLAISSTQDGDTFTRFNSSVTLLRDILQQHRDNKLNNSSIIDVIAILNDKEKLNDVYFNAFKASLMIADLAVKIFVSKKVRGNLFADNLVDWSTGESEESEIDSSTFIYNLPDGFNDETIKAPLSYLLFRMSKLLNDDKDLEDLERQTVILFLALNSNN